MRLVLPGQEVSFNEPGRAFARHHHLRAYAALFVSGRCDEAGDCGRFHARQGDVLIHSAFEAHQDRIGPAGAQVINLMLDGLPGSKFGYIADLDAIVRAYEREPADAAILLREQFRPHSPIARDWPDMLAIELSRPSATRLEEWADSHGLSPNSLSRGFRLAYGVTPKRFRFEQMVSRAARSTRTSSDSLSMIAADAGFADQPHMTRAMVQLFGATPSEIRRMS